MEKHEWDARLFDHMMNAYSNLPGNWTGKWNI